MCHEWYENRIIQIQRKLGKDLLVITNPWNCLYLAGLTEPGTLVIDSNDFKIFVPEFDVNTKELWDGQVLNDTDLVDYLNKAAENLESALIDTPASWLNQLTEDFSAKIKMAPEIVEELRAVKEDPEIDQISETTAIAGDAIAKATKIERHNLNEARFSAELEYFAKVRGVHCIISKIASGVNSANLFSKVTDKVIDNNEVVMIDVNAERNYYWTDITETIISPVNKEQVQCRKVVKKALDSMIKAVKPGLSFSSLATIGSKILEEAGFANNMLHDFGHGVGLSSHELPLVSTTNHSTIKPNMVFTLEPGLYFPNKFGCRLETVVVAKNSGVEVLYEPQII